MIEDLIKAEIDTQFALLAIAKDDLEAAQYNDDRDKISKRDDEVRNIGKVIVILQSFLPKTYQPNIDTNKLKSIRAYQAYVKAINMVDMLKGQTPLSFEEFLLERY